MDAERLRVRISAGRLCIGRSKASMNFLDSISNAHIDEIWTVAQSYNADHFVIDNLSLRYVKGVDPFMSSTLPN